MAFVKSCSIDSRNKQSPTCEVVHETKSTSEISCPTDCCLAQLVRHWPEDPEVLVSNPTGGNFWHFFFAFPCVNICQIIWQKCLSWKTQLSVFWDQSANVEKSWHLPIPSKKCLKLRCHGLQNRQCHAPFTLVNSIADPIVHSTNTILATLAEWSILGKHSSEKCQ